MSLTGDWSIWVLIVACSQTILHAITAGRPYLTVNLPPIPGALWPAQSAWNFGSLDYLCVKCQVVILSETLSANRVGINAPQLIKSEQRTLKVRSLLLQSLPKNPVFPANSIPDPDLLRVVIGFTKEECFSTITWIASMVCPSPCRQQLQLFTRRRILREGRQAQLVAIVDFSAGCREKQDEKTQGWVELAVRALSASHRRLCMIERCPLGLG